MPVSKRKSKKVHESNVAANGLLQRIGEHFDEFQQNGSGYKALCPAHVDSNPSLSISEGEDGRILLHCHAGCDTEDIVEEAGLQMKDLFPSEPASPRIVATYNYPDENGNLLYQSVRYEPKDFRQRRPNGKGWIWNTKDTRKVLYRLPELLKAKKAKRVYIVEGEKDVDRLRSMGLVATTNVGGAGKWKPEYSESLSGRHVVVLPDNDDAGRDHANEVTKALHGKANSVRIVELPGLSKNGDVSDWLDAGGTREKLLKLGTSTPPYALRPTHTTGNPTDPTHPTVDPDAHSVGQVGRRVPPLVFPTEVFPAPLCRFIESTAVALPCPTDFVGAMVLPVLATMIGTKRRIEVAKHWVQPPRIWVVVVARSGLRKTPAFSLVTKPLQSKQGELQAEYLRAKKDYEATPKDDRQSVPRPVLKQILVNDATVEALKDVLAHDDVCYARDELSGWVRAMSQYKLKGDDRQIWLSIKDGVPILVNRKGLDEPIWVSDPFVNVVGGIQPSILGDLIDDCREDGFSARLLYAYPEEIKDKSWRECTVEGGADYQKICNDLWGLPSSDDPLPFGSDAKSRWVEWINTHRYETAPDNLMPFWAKLEGHCASFALVLFLTHQVCNETNDTAIGLPSIEGAIKLVNYFKSHVKKTYDEQVTQSDEGRIGRFLKWMKRRGLTEVTAREVQQLGVAGIRNKSDDAKQLLLDAAELGHGNAFESDQGSLRFYLHTPNTTPTHPTPAKPNKKKPKSGLAQHLQKSTKCAALKADIRRMEKTVAKKGSGKAIRTKKGAKRC